MKTTIRFSVVKELDGKGYVFGGKLARIVADLHCCKESNVERRCRELENEEIIERKLVDNPSGGNQVVAYRIKPKEPTTMKLI